MLGVTLQPRLRRRPAGGGGLCGGRCRRCGTSQGCSSSKGFDTDLVASSHGEFAAIGLLISMPTSDQSNSRSLRDLPLGKCGSPKVRNTCRMLRISQAPSAAHGHYSVATSRNCNPCMERSTLAWERGDLRTVDIAPLSLADV